MRHCSVSACETFVPGPMIASAPPICPKSALSLLPLIRPPTTFPTTRIRDEKLDAFGVPGHHPRVGVGQTRHPHRKTPCFSLRMEGRGRATTRRHRRFALPRGLAFVIYDICV